MIGGWGKKLVQRLAVATMAFSAAASLPASAATPQLVVSATYLLAPPTMHKPAMPRIMQEPITRAMPAAPLFGSSQINSVDACSNAIATAEHAYGVPNGLLTAIGLAESGLLDPRNGFRRPWPWTIDVDGKGRFFASKEDALNAVTTIERSGAHSVDIGCMQINLGQHPGAFQSLAEAFDPLLNADYAARYLLQLHRDGLDWLQAAGSYHSYTPGVQAPYLRLVEQFYAGLRSLPGSVPNSALVLPEAVSVSGIGSAPQAGLLLIRPEELRADVARDIAPLTAIRMLSIADALQLIGRTEAARVVHVKSRVAKLSAQ
jgi:Transglycosylase SLT domain